MRPNLYATISYRDKSTTIFCFGLGARRLCFSSMSLPQVVCSLIRCIFLKQETHFKLKILIDVFLCLYINGSIRINYAQNPCGLWKNMRVTFFYYYFWYRCLDFRCLIFAHFKQSALLQLFIEHFSDTKVHCSTFDTILRVVTSCTLSHVLENIWVLWSSISKMANADFPDVWHAIFKYVAIVVDSALMLQRSFSIMFLQNLHLAFKFLELTMHTMKFSVVLGQHHTKVLKLLL